MFRKALLPALAVAMLSACATDYSYRNGNGDYYYGRPQVEYRHIGGYGSYGYGSYGGYGGVGYGVYGGYPGYGAYGYGGGYGRPVYYYDRFGRLVYGYPYGAYGSPYSQGYWQHRPRSPYRGGHGHQDGRNGDEDSKRPPPWRNFGGLQPGVPNERVQRSEDAGMRRMPSPFMEPAMPAERMRARPSMERAELGSQREARARRVAEPMTSMDRAEE